MPNTIQIPSSLASGPPDPLLTYVFEASTGRLAETGFVVMVDIANSESLTLTTNAQGVISY